MDTDVRPIDVRSGPVEALVRPPGSKSITNRALVLASLARPGASRLSGALEADDTVVMRSGLRDLGVLIDDVDDPWLVLGTGGQLTAPARPIDAGASGTTARFLTAIAPLADGPVTVDGSRRMRERPIGELTDALAVLGADVSTAGGYPPVVIEGSGIHGGAVTVDGRRSSQFVSALLMLAPMLDGPSQISLVEGDLVSRPYVDGTVRIMREFGAVVEDRHTGYGVAPSGYEKAHIEIEADASAAAYPLVAAAVTGGVVVITGIPVDSIQPDLRLIEVLAAMGCVVTRDANSIRLIGPDRLEPVDVDMNDAPDAVLALSIACLFARGPSRIRNIGNLRLKETDRLEALRTELNRVGAAASIEGDDLVIRPGGLRPARISTYDDHRMAMSFAVAGLRIPGIEIADPGCVAKTWPGYFDMLDAL
ncbi:MAG TPA: 3-phosphoshikimate 1-carboxyvinyltransferase [Acidimicrobiia bacterium]